MFEPVVILGQVGGNTELVRHFVLHHILHTTWKLILGKSLFFGNFFLLNNLSGLVTSWPHLRVQEAGNTQLSLSQAEGQAVVGEDVGRVEALIVQEVRTEVMDDGAECEAVPEGSWQVLNPHIVVVRHNPPSPDLNKRFSCWLKLTNLPWELWDLGPPQETSFLTECQHGISCCAVSGQQSWNSANSNILCSIQEFECCFFFLWRNLFII